MNLPVHFIGQETQGGTYLLRIHLRKEIKLSFGRFQSGKIFTLQKGEYVYVGSALNPNGATSLAPRLLRHASRSGELPPHFIRDELHKKFIEVGLGSARLVPPKSKKLHWNVDHLLDLLDADLLGVLVIHSPVGLEAEIGRGLVDDQGTEVIVPGLGANDVQGGTHLLRAVGGDGWWKTLVDRLENLYGPRFPVADA